MNFSIIRKIGEKIISVVEWPFVHSVALAHMLRDALADTPKTRDAIVGLVKEFEVMGPDAVEIYAEHGLNIPEDLKAVADVKGLFTYFKDTFLPAVEKEYADLKTDSAAFSAQPAPAPEAPAPALANGPADFSSVAPGLHNVTPA